MRIRNCPATVYPCLPTGAHGSQSEDLPTARPADERIKAQNYIDLTMTAKIGDHYSFRLGVNNIFDREYTQYLNADPSPGFNAKASLTMKF